MRVVADALQRTLRDARAADARAQIRLLCGEPKPREESVRLRPFPTNVKRTHVMSLRPLSLFVCETRTYRYASVLAIENTRVRLPSETYINANHVTLDGAQLHFIATQSPLPNTEHDFWEMCFEQESKGLNVLSGFCFGLCVLTLVLFFVMFFFFVCVFRNSDCLSYAIRTGPRHGLLSRRRLHERLRRCERTVGATCIRERSVLCLHCFTNFGVLRAADPSAWSVECILRQ